MASDSQLPSVNAAGRGIFPSKSSAPVRTSIRCTSCQLQLQARCRPLLYQATVSPLTARTVAGGPPSLAYASIGNRRASWPPWAPLNTWGTEVPGTVSCRTTTPRSDAPSRVRPAVVGCSGTRTVEDTADARPVGMIIVTQVIMTIPVITARGLRTEVPLRNGFDYRRP